MDGVKAQIMGNKKVWQIINSWILGFINYGISKNTKPTFLIFVESLDVEIKTSLHAKVPYQAQFSWKGFKWLL